VGRLYFGIENSFNRDIEIVGLYIGVVFMRVLTVAIVLKTYDFTTILISSIPMISMINNCQIIKKKQPGG
jgi:hypothetical protein